MKRAHLDTAEALIEVAVAPTASSFWEQESSSGIRVSGSGGPWKRFGEGAMRSGQEGVLVEIFAKKKGCMLCDLAISILEEISKDFHGKPLQWTVVDMGDPEGLGRHVELTGICGRRPPVPCVVINGTIAFDHIPDLESLRDAVVSAMES